MAADFIEQNVENFAAYCVPLAQLATIQGLKALAGDIPSYPVTIVHDTDRSDAQALRDTWTANNLVYDAGIAAAEVVRKAAQSALVDYERLPFPQNEWVALTAGELSFYPYGSKVWIAYAPAKNPSLVVLQSEPASPFKEWILGNPVPAPPSIVPDPPLASPTLHAAIGATVDNNFNITFTDDPIWRLVVNAVYIGGRLLPTRAWSISEGILTLKPSESSLLQTADTQDIDVHSLGHDVTTVSQRIEAGAATHLSIDTQPTAPLANGDPLAQQPIIIFLDQYGNIAVDADIDVVATHSGGTWTIGGTTTEPPASGIATFTDLTATSVAEVPAATITFTAAPLPAVVSDTFDIPAP